MTKRQQIYLLNKRANGRIEWIKRSDRNLFPEKTSALIDALFFKTSKLNNVTSGNLRIGALNREDEQAYINAVQNFLDNPLTTYRGQRVDIVSKGFETFKTNHPDIEVTKSQYTDLVRIWESDTFQKFKENFDTYSGVIAEMVKSPKEYGKAIAFLAGVNRSNKESGKYATDGVLDAKRFIEEWKGRQ